MEYGKAITDAFAYARHSKAALLYAGFVLATLLAVGILLVLTAAAFGMSSNPAAWLRQPVALGAAVLIVLAGIVVFAVGSLAVSGTIIRNAANAETLSQSWTAFRPRLGAMVGVALATSAVSFASSMLFETLGSQLPSASGVFFTLQMAASLILAFFLAFAEYAVVLEGKGTADALRRSIQLAREKPVDVLMAILVAGFLVLAVALAAVLILVLLLGLAFVLLRLRLNALSLPALVLLGIGGILALFLIMAAQVMQLHVMANAFRQFTAAPAGRITEASAPRPAAARKAPARKPARKPVRRSAKK